MRTWTSPTVFFCASASVAAALACSGKFDTGGLGVEGQAITASDLALASSILSLVGSPTGACAGCHLSGADEIRRWGKALKNIDEACFVRPNLTSPQRVDCLRITPTDSASSFSAAKLGFYAAGASFDQARDLFQAAFPATDWIANWEKYKSDVGMPNGRSAPMPEADFTKVKTWMLRGMPQLDEAAAAEVASRITVRCVESTTPQLAAHIEKMRTQGWGARLADQSTAMFGCGPATNALACLSSLPDIGPQLGADGVVQKIRKLRQQPFRSSFWARSSADGRFVALGPLIVDLTKPDTAKPIRVDAQYDPSFLPSNDGFSFAGADFDDSTRICKQSLLSDVSSQAQPTITMKEAKCASVGSEVYQSMSTALDGARYFMATSDHENDDGANEITRPMPARFGPNATMTLTPMLSNGTSYKAQPSVAVALPGEGDVVLSPSSLLLIDRFSGGEAQGGYRIRALDTRSNAGALDIQVPLRAELCLKGSKAMFSFDERFVATHQYVGRGEPDQAMLPDDSSNIVIADLRTGRNVRLTNMAAGQYALYPHFRADGWLYFIVRDANTDIEYIAATDATLRLAAQ